MRIKDKVAVITGGSSGIGASLVKTLVTSGAKVVFGDIDQVLGEKLAEGLNKEHKDSTVFVLCDVTDKNQYLNLFLVAEKTFGGIDVYKVAVITGGSSGIGASLVKTLVTSGAKVVFGDIDQVLGEKLAEGLNKEHKDSTVFVLCDVTDKNQYLNLFLVAEKTFGGIDIVCNNAGIAQANEFYDDSRNFIKTINVNLTAVIEGTQIGIKFLKKRGGGVIINTASMSGVNPWSVAPVYSAAKSGVIGFTRALYNLKKENIRVNAIAPYFAETAMVKVAIEKNPDFAEVIKRHGTLSTNEVVNAFIHVIENDYLFADIVKVTQKNLFEVLPKVKL
ncbi:hypothetical protein Glove_441g58 [Diversispora epigaea]|uniref:Uncharacterized protein n=1 Tax=Diversispora epigaea TaxID=1348612 RepID=A0A397GRA0_9GLOM|nr:hypothetical protein Glove_441g58 [Diversispora epigaea]